MAKGEQDGEFDKQMQVRDKEQAEKSSHFEKKIAAKEAGVKPPKEDKPAKIISPPPTAPAAQDIFQNPQGPYVEKGIASNNEAKK